jgi:hypothetical protein
VKHRYRLELQFMGMIIRLLIEPAEPKRRAAAV